MVVDSVWPQREVSFIARRDFGGGVRVVLGQSPWATSMAMANGSGHRQWHVGTVSILLGRGDGTFEAAPDVGVGASCFNYGGRLQWRWPAGSGHGECRADTVSICWGRAMAPSAGQDCASGRHPCVYHRRRLQWRWPAGSGHCQSRANTVSVLLGRGDGTFGRPKTLPWGRACLQVTVGDFNGDGHQDLATANDGPNSVSILLGRGDGTFAPAQEFAVVRRS